MVSDLKQVTREGISNLQTICERAADVQKDVYICFIDYTKAFDRVKHFKMIECLSEIGIDNKDLQNNNQTVLGTVSVCKNRKWNDI